MLKNPNIFKSSVREPADEVVYLLVGKIATNAIELDDFGKVSVAVIIRVQVDVSRLRG